MVLSQLAIRVGTGSVEITEGCPVQAIRFPIPSEDAFDHPLRLTIRINRGLDVLLANGDACRNPVSRTAGRKNNMLYRRVHHGVQQPERVGHIVAKILSWAPHRLSHVRETCKVDNGLDSVGFDYFANQRGITEGSFYQRAPFHGPPVRGREVIEYDWLKP